MQKSKASQLFEAAKAYCEENYQEELNWAYSITPDTFKNLRSKRFLSEYCWAVYAAGFKYSRIQAVFPRIRRAFKEFELVSLARMRSIEPALAVFHNTRKARSFLEGSKLIAREGFSVFKKRLSEQGVDMLEELPGIGSIAKFHLAKNIGLVDAPKPDIWLVRAASACSSTVDELVDFLSAKYKISRHVVDVILWRYGADQWLGLSRPPRIRFR